MSVVDVANFLPADPGVDADRFKQSMRRLAGAVSIITVGSGEERTGFTATSVSSFSLDPPIVLVSLDRASSSWPALQREGAFAVNVLAGDQHAIADRFAGRGDVKGRDRYAGADWVSLGTGALGLPGALVVLDCELEEAIERHSHSILLGRVRSVAIQSDARPLLYWQGRYRGIAAGDI